MSASSSTPQFYRRKPHHSAENRVRLTTGGRDAGQPGNPRKLDLPNWSLHSCRRQRGEHGQALDEAAVADFVAAMAVPYKKIRRVEFTEAVPKPSSGEILRRLLTSG